MNMTGLFGESHGNSVAGAKLQAQLCKKHGFSTCFPGAAAVDTVPLDAAVKGYFVKDEPHAADFAKYGAEAAAIRDKRPGALAFVNMLGSDATMYEGEPIPWMEHWWGTYESYCLYFRPASLLTLSCVRCCAAMHACVSEHPYSDPPLTVPRNNNNNNVATRNTEHGHHDWHHDRTQA